MTTGGQGFCPTRSSFRPVTSGDSSRGCVSAEWARRPAAKPRPMPQPDARPPCGSCCSYGAAGAVGLVGFFKTRRAEGRLEALDETSQASHQLGVVPLRDGVAGDLLGGLVATAPTSCRRIARAGRGVPQPLQRGRDVLEGGGEREPAGSPRRPRRSRARAPAPTRVAPEVPGVGEHVDEDAAILPPAALPRQYC